VRADRANVLPSFGVVFVQAICREAEESIGLVMVVERSTWYVAESCGPSSKMRASRKGA
jgi:hypothetical protein